MWHELRECLWARRFRATLILHTTCVRSWCNGCASCVAAKYTHKKKLGKDLKRIPHKYGHICVGFFLSLWNYEFRLLWECCTWSGAAFGGMSRAYRECVCLSGSNHTFTSRTALHLSATHLPFTLFLFFFPFFLCCCKTRKSLLRLSPWP